MRFKTKLFPTVRWERYPCDFRWKCPSWPYDCEACLPSARYKNGEVRLNLLKIRGVGEQVECLFHELVHFLMDKLKLSRTFHERYDALCNRVDSIGVLKFRCDTCCFLLTVRRGKQVTCPYCGSIFNYHTALKARYIYMVRHDRPF